MTRAHWISLLSLSLAIACGGSRSALRGPPPGDRVSDSPRERMSGIPVPDPTADPENQDSRFGVDSARDRGATIKQKREERQRCLDLASKAQAEGKKPPPCLPPKK
jgi:hypothetical protein